MRAIREYAHNVCFSCRKSWAPITVWYSRLVFKWQEKRNCPDCGEPLVGLGLAFRPPKQTDRREWKKLEKAYNTGNEFFKP